MSGLCPDDAVRLWSVIKTSYGLPPMPNHHRPRRFLMALLGLATIGLGMGLHITAKAHDAAPPPSGSASGPVIAYLPLTTTASPALIAIDINSAGQPQPSPQPMSMSAATVPDPIPLVIDQSGPVQTGARIYVVFIGSYWQAGNGSDAEASMSQTLNFYRRVGTSQYNQVLAQYRGAGANSQLVGAWIQPDAAGWADDPAASLPSIISAAHIPTGLQTQVDLIYPPGFTFSDASEPGAVGYHSWADGVTYAAVSSVADYPGSLTVTASHEYDETELDPVTGAAAAPGLPNHAFGFADSATSRTILEVADVCETQLRCCWTVSQWRECTTRVRQLASRQASTADSSPNSYFRRG